MWAGLFERAVAAIVRTGSLEITMPDGDVRRFGDGTGKPVAVTLHDPDLPRRIVLNPDIGVGEGYTEGTLTIADDDLAGFLSLVVTNGGNNGQTTWLAVLNQLRQVTRVLTQWNPVGKAQSNVAHHYDLSGELYDLFLDSDKQYSCGYFRSPDDTLEQAQAQKKAHIADKLLIRPGMRVLDIGCGWGGMAMTLARDYGAQVVGVTLSEEQHKVATRRVHQAGLEGQVDIRLADYRNVAETFDRIVSVGMFEHVGVPHYREYFRHVHDRLARDGVALIHTIGRASPPGHTSPWLTKYIFPGGYVPAMSEMMAAVEKEDLFAADMEILRLHYAETLRHWHDRFVANIDKARALYDEKFCRMWRYYLLACEMTFRHSRQVVFQVQLSHRIDAVPLTRDYLYRATDDKAEQFSHAAE